MRKRAVGAVLIAAAALACGGRDHGAPPPPCGPTGPVTDLAFSPTTVNATQYPGGPMPTNTPPPENGFAIDASSASDGAALQLDLVGFYAGTVQTTCVTNLHGSFTRGSTTLTPIAALVTVDQVVTTSLARGRVLHVWLDDGAGGVSRSDAFAYEGPYLVP